MPWSHQSKTTTSALPRNLLLSCETPTSAQCSGFKSLGGRCCLLLDGWLQHATTPRKLRKPYLMLNAVWLRMTFCRFLNVSFLPTRKNAPDMILLVFVPPKPTRNHTTARSQCNKYLQNHQLHDAFNGSWVLAPLWQLQSNSPEWYHLILLKISAGTIYFALFRCHSHPKE